MAITAAAAVVTSMFIPAASAAPGDTTFHASFESGETSPALTPAGTPVNVTDQTFSTGSLLAYVTAVTASAQNAPNEAAGFAADGNSGTKWLAFQPNGWLRYQLSSPQPMTSYTITSANDAAERDPRNFTVEGSNDGSSWTVLDTQTNQTWGSRFLKRTFELAEPTAAYSYYRLNITAVNGTQNLLQVADFEPLNADGPTPPANPLSLVVNSGPAAGWTAKSNVGWDGVRALQYSGRHLAAGDASSEHILYADLGLEIDADSQLSYTVFPMLDGGQTYSSTFVALDVVFTDGTRLSELGATDKYGYDIKAASQGAANKLWPDQWNKITVDLGAYADKTIDDILFVYDRPGAAIGGIETPDGETTVTGWIDDIRLDHFEPLDTSDGLVSYVDTRRGTNSTGGYSRANNFPAVAWPNGFNFITPMSTADGYSTLYHYQRENNAQNLPMLAGIGFSHEPSIWMGDRNSFAVLPSASASPTSTINDRKLAFRHENELARPDIYSVTFENGIETAVTATDHGAIYRFDFTGDASSVLIDKTGGDSNISINGNVVSGWVDGGSGWPGRTRMFIYGTFDTTPMNAGSTTVGNRNGSARFAAFDTQTDKTVELRIASSMISLDQAQKNYDFELEGVSFQQAHDAVKAEWNDRLSIVTDVQGASEDQLINLYSNIYRLNLYPNSQFENTGTEANPVYKYASPFQATQGAATNTTTNAVIQDGKVYVNNGLWDTYRTAWPLYALLYPEKTNELVDGFVQHYRDGGWIARWSSPGYADLMTGTSSDVAFAEAYMAGSLETDVALEAYDAALKNATVLPASNAVGRKGLNSSIFQGYTEKNTHESVSWGLEGYINDFGIANMAAKLAEDPNTPDERREQLREEAAYFTDRANHFVEHFNPEATPEVGSFQGRNLDGTWGAYDPFQWQGDFTEASAWTFAFHAPHNVDGLAALYGGREGLIDNLHNFLTVREKADRSGIHEAREARDVRAGMLGISNQITHHIPSVLGAAGDISGSQALIRDLQQRMSVGGDIGQGYPGDEDNGEFSSWFVFHAMGFYPMEVGSGDYTIGSPLFDSMTVNLDGGPLVINAPGASAGQKYIAGVNINGEELTTLSLPGDQVRAGGTLNFTMSDVPTSWAALDLNESLEVPHSPLDVTKAGRGTTTVSDGVNAAAVVDDRMNTSTAFPSNTATVTWKSLSGPVSLTGYTLTGVDRTKAPNSWTLSGSNDGNTWTEIDTRDNEEFKWTNQTRPFATPGGTTQGYLYYKLDLETTSTNLVLAEVELFAVPTDAEGLTVTGIGASVDLGDEFTGVIGSVVGELPAASDYTVTVTYGDGSAPVPGVLTQNELGAWLVSAPHTFSAAGHHPVTISVVDADDRTAIATSTVEVTFDQTFEGAMGPVCIGDLGLTQGSCDGLGYTYFRDKLAADGFVQGQTNTIPGTALTYDLPAIPAGAPDNVTGDGATFAWDSGVGATQISFIGTANEGDQQTTATLTFSDGTTVDVPLNFGDWVGASGAPKFGNIVLAVSEGRLAGLQPEGSVKNTAVYATAPYSLPLDGDGAPKRVAKVTMPQQPGELRNGRVHVFAMGSDGDRSGSVALEVEALPVVLQKPGVAFTADLAVVTGGEADKSVVINWGDGTNVDASATVASDKVSASHTYAEAGTYTVWVTVNDGVQAKSAQVTIVVNDNEFTPTITADPNTQVAPGADVTVDGLGYLPGEQVVITFGDTEKTVTTDQDGAFTTTVTVPALSDGTYAITATGQTSGASAQTDVSVQTPAAPAVSTTTSLVIEPGAPVVGVPAEFAVLVLPTDAVGTVFVYPVGSEVAIGSASVDGEGIGRVTYTFDTAGEQKFIARFVPEDAADFVASESAELTVNVQAAALHQAPEVDAMLVGDNITLEVELFDSATLTTLQYRINGGSWLDYTGPVPAAGVTLIEYYAVDSLGGESGIGSLNPPVPDPSEGAEVNPLGVERTILVGDTVRGYGVHLTSNGSAVRDAIVVFEIDGPGQFADGTTSANALTNGAGIAIAPAVTGVAAGEVSIIAYYFDSETWLAPITVEEPAAAEISVNVSAEQVSGKWVLNVQVNNPEAADSIQIKTRYGTKTFTNVSAGGNLSYAVKTFVSKLPAGTVTVTVKDANGTTIINENYGAQG